MTLATGIVIGDFRGRTGGWRLAAHFEIGHLFLERRLEPLTKPLDGSESHPTWAVLLGLLRTYPKTSHRLEAYATK
jgi:hypothetical protein